MPLLIQKIVAPRQTLGIWQLSERPKELLQMLDSDPAEFNRYLLLAHDSRRQQWLASRVLLGELTGSKKLTINYDEYNKPFIKDSPLKISISHSHGLVAVIVNQDRETGIDIELVKPKIERITTKFMSQTEMKALDEKHRLESLYVHWCAKEALYKLYGKKELIFKDHIRVHPFIYQAEGLINGSITTYHHNQTYQLRYEKINEHLLVYVLNT